MINRFFKLSTITILFLSLFAFNLSAKEGYEIKVKIDNYKAKSLYLLNYYAKSTLYTDTTELNASGEFVFKGDTALPGGMYVILLEQKKAYFEILLDKDQHFTIHTDSIELVKNMKIKGSVDNEEFYTYLFFIGEQQKLLKEIQDKKAAAKTDEEKEKFDNQLNALNDKVKAFQKDYYTTKPDRLFSAILKAGEEPEIPTELPLKEDGQPDSSYIFKYYKQHYFDGFDFDDARLVRTKIYAQKIDRYYKQLLLKHPDSIIKEGDRIIQLSKGSYDTYKYTIWFFTYKTETSQIMGMDKAFVFFAKKYYLSGEAKWASDAIIKNMTERVTKLERILIGKVAPNLIMMDTTANGFLSLHSIPAEYTVVVFWDPDCGHCKTELPKIRDWANGEGKEYGVKIFAVCSDTNIRKWKKELRTKNYNFINVNGTRSVTQDYHDLYDIISTPVIFILDREKKIVAKKVSHTQMEDIIKRDYEKNHKKEEE